MNNINENTKGPYILWRNDGYNGWSPESFDTIQKALEAEKYSSGWIITKNVEYKVEEK